ncbi:MAG: hypothetical protein K0S29_1064 [Gammaproteobacteria bacterium]|nr:hypothetical protein [Gammaproteobacteria bacterium]
MNVDKTVSTSISIRDLKLEGLLRMPQNPIGLVLFSHGSGSGRLSARNNFVADVLLKANIASLLFDLLTEKEDQTYANRFDIELLSKRLIEVSLWAKNQASINTLPMGYFGASTGAASAIEAAAELDFIKAVVSRGGRPDLANSKLSRLKAPTLLIVGGHDPQVLLLNQSAYARIHCVKKLEIVANASHLFEEAGTLEQAALLAKNWFIQYLAQ